MNQTALLNFESMKSFGAQTESSGINRLVADALRRLIQELFIQTAPFFIVTLSCRRSGSFNFYRSIMELLYNSVDNMIIQLVYLNYTQPIRIEGRRLHNLLLVDSLEAFLDIDIVSYTRNYDSNEYYHILLQQRDSDLFSDMIGIFEYCWIHKLINCNVQIQESNGDVYIYTYFPYTQDHCGQILPAQTNRFLGSRWESNNFFPHKLKNFYKCQLTVVVKPIAPFFMIEEDVNGNNIYSGLEGRLLTELAQKLNFSFKIIVSQVEEDSKNMYMTSIAMLSGGEAHIGIGYFRLRSENTNDITTTFPHYQSTVVACILLAAHNLTAFQILTFPFAMYSWLAIFLTILMAAISMIVISKSISMSSALLDVISVTLGISVSMEPRRVQKRFIYCSLLFGGLVLRSIYSARLYHLFRNNIHQKFPTTIMELTQQKYAMIIASFTRREFDGVPYFDHLAELPTTTLYSAHVQMFSTLPLLEQHIYEYMFAVTSNNFLIYYSTINRKAGIFYTIPESLMHVHLTIYLSKHSHLVGQLDETLHSIQSAGLVQYWGRQQEDIKYFKSRHYSDDRLIRQHDLTGIYITMAILHGLALLIFSLELFSMKCNWLQRVF